MNRPFSEETTKAAYAMTWAFFAHAKQHRKYSGEPYIVHPCEVVALLQQADVYDDEVLAAAWLHDVIEDCDVGFWEIEEALGSRVATYVIEVTDPTTPEFGNRAARKKAEREWLAEASPEAKSIKLADLISNTRSIVRDDPNFAKQYLQEKALLLPHLTEGNKWLFDMATDQLSEALAQEW